MERMERPESVIHHVGIAKAPVSKKPGVERVLYGVWDSAKKVAESQSPEAWKKRIITVIDRQIIPRLPPDKQQWVDDHWEGIQEAATYAGVGITTAEILVDRPVLPAKKQESEIIDGLHQSELAEQAGGFLF